MSIDNDTARKVANLSRIAIAEEKLPELSAALNNVLALVDRLQSVDVSGVEPLTSVLPMNAPLRADQITDGNRVDDILANAPLAREGFFAVPKVVE